MTIGQPSDVTPRQTLSLRSVRECDLLQHCLCAIFSTQSIIHVLSPLSHPHAAPLQWSPPCSRLTQKRQEAETLFSSLSTRKHLTLLYFNFSIQSCSTRLFLLSVRTLVSVFQYLAYFGGVALLMRCSGTSSTQTVTKFTNPPETAWHTQRLRVFEIQSFVLLHADWMSVKCLYGPPSVRDTVGDWGRCGTCDYKMTLVPAWVSSSGASLLSLSRDVLSLTCKHTQQWVRWYINATRREGKCG